MKPGLPADPERWRQISDLFDRALDLPADERGAFLRRACGDAELRAQAEALLAAGEAADGFLAPEARLRALGLLEEAPELMDLGPYRLIREIGAGGMGVVYEAEDLRLRRRVAVKMLPPDFGREPGARERFLREARAASALDDPNICTVHDVGEAGGRLYLVMAYYEGETLKDRLQRGPLPVPEARRIAIQAARALDRAHGAGIIHRDIKPANVMLTSRGEVKVLDFGIARMRGDATLTREGRPPGTPAYMAPEQLAGEPADARTDLWGLGALLYEMLAGRRPFAGEDRTREPEPLERLRREIPVALARTVARALSRDPARRQQSAEELLMELESGKAPAILPRRRMAVLAAGVLVAGLLAGGGWWVSRQEPAASVPAVPVVGVVELANRTGDPALDGYGRAISRLVMDSLSPSRHLQVASEPRMAALAAPGGSPAELSRRAADAGLDVLLTGEILAAPGGLLVAARLEETRGGRVLAARRLTVPDPAQLFLAADGIVLEARKGLGLPPAESVGGLSADFLAENPDAYGDYVRGLTAFLEYRYDEAEPAFAAALAKAPGFVMARYRLALVQYVTSRTDEALANIRQAASEADRLPDREARYIRAGEALFARRADEAVAAYRQLVELYPYEVEAHLLLAQALMSRRRYEEALEVLDVLARLEPDSSLPRAMAGESNLELRRFDRAAAVLREALDRNPSDAYARHTLARVYQELGETGLAAGELEETLRRNPGYPFAVLALAKIDGLQGRRDLAETRLRSIASNPAALPRHRVTAGFELAGLYRSQGRLREAEASLAALNGEIGAERVREASALTERGLALLESGAFPAARPLLEAAVARAEDHRGRRVCALYARGRLELLEKRWEDLEGTLRQLLGSPADPAEPDRREQKAAASLRGLRRLEEGRPAEAVDELSRAVALDGGECALYRLGLARAWLAAGRLPEALAAAREATEAGEEPERIRALLVLARIQEALGRPREAAGTARRFLEVWARADRGLPELAEARRLAALAQPVTP